MVLQRFKEHYLYAKIEKCEFWQPEVIFLRHIVSVDGIKVDSAKIEVVRDWPRQWKASKVRSYLGLAGYYRHFIDDFLKIATPLTELMRKNLWFTWSDKCEGSFQELKRQLVTASVLNLPSNGDKFLVY
ncbi:uncharacterized mitochondrial protein AtMg00860-like [Humulus lupulus]|uniref:uncharacterized mitochondrial protein AtMg00860-like n=1 Tax=Humulus lupulus TaxID=3486 RepID=UPI002B411B58|nr:uncharacterized mitochondrial protein AtMg00860-like [Humulus lupulus]